MATPELRHMLRDDDLNHEEQKQVLELAIKFHNDRFYHQPFAGPQGIAVIFDKPSTFQLLHWRCRTGRLSAGHRQVRIPAGPWRTGGRHRTCA